MTAFMFWHPRVPGFNGWSLGKHLSTMTRNFLPTLFLTLPSHDGCIMWSFVFYGWLYHVIFILQFLLFLVACLAWGLDLRLLSLTLCSDACWYEPMATLKTNSVDEILFSRLLIFCGMFFSNAEGWLISRWTYNNLLSGFMYVVCLSGFSGLASSVSFRNLWMRSRRERSFSVLLYQSLMKL